RVEPGFDGPATPRGVHRDHVEAGVDGRSGGAVADPPQLDTVEEALGVTPPDRQLEVVARRAHGGGDGRPVDTDLQRLLDQESLVRPPLVDGAGDPTLVASDREAPDEPALGTGSGHCASLRGPGSPQPRNRTRPADVSKPFFQSCAILRFLGPPRPDPALPHPEAMAPAPTLAAPLSNPYLAFSAQLLDPLPPVGSADPRPAHPVVFQHIDPAGSRITDLARRAQMTKPS